MTQATPIDIPARSATRNLTTALADIKLAHSVFALPFALLAAFLAASPFSNWARFSGQLTLILCCMVLARTWAMLLNRIADRRIDADNPRTARRAIASGRLATRAARVIAAACALLFLIACALFLALYANPRNIAGSGAKLSPDSFAGDVSSIQCHQTIGRYGRVRPATASP